MTSVEIRKQILEFLEVEIKSDYVLLDLPYYNNVGDVLIWQSALDMLKRIKHKCLYFCSIETYVKPNLSENVLIIFMGGGNFGDLWERHQQFRYKVMRDFPNNPILQLPQSVWFESEKKLKYDIDFFANHKGRVTICLRDKQSFGIISSHYHTVDPVLLPDMALSFDVESFCRKHRIKQNDGNGNLLVKRGDKESVDLSSFKLPYFSKEGDWPSMESTLPELKKLNCILSCVSKCRFLTRYKNKIVDYYWKRFAKDAIIKSGVSLLIPYKTVYATRLHAAILALLLRKEVFIIDNSYGKIKGVYDYCMSDLKNVKML